MLKFPLAFQHTNIPDYLEYAEWFPHYLEYAEIRDLGNLMSVVQKYSRLWFSTVSFFLRAISQRENFMKDSCCVRGRLCASPGHWTRDLQRHPPCAAELPDDFELPFLLGKPWYFSQHVFEPWRANKHVHYPSSAPYFRSILTNVCLEIWFCLNCHSIIWYIFSDECRL